MIQIDEIWKPVLGYEGLYDISNHGIVRSWHDKINGYSDEPRVLTLTIGTTGYYFVNLFRDKKPKFWFIHRLVAIAFISNPINKKEVNHIDGNKLNNHVSNLEWVSRSENQQHAYDNGLNYAPRGEKCGTSKLKEHEILEIRRLFKTGQYMQKDLAKTFGTNQGHISRIVLRRCWTHI